jgi:Tol biopolymer transport system component
MQVVHLDDGRRTTLSTDGSFSIASPALSRNGKELAYVEGNADAGNALDVVSTLTGSKRRVVSMSSYRYIESPTWSADSKWIAFTLVIRTGPLEFSPESGIWLIRSDGKDLHFIGRGLNPAWSPNGAWLAYIGGPRRVETTGIGVGFTPQEAIFMVHPDGQNRMQLSPWTTDQRAPSTSEPLSW